MNHFKRSTLILSVLVLIALLVIPRTAPAVTVDDVKVMMANVNGQLAGMGENLRLEVVEYYTGLHEAGQIVYFDNRTLQLSSHWVPADPNRGGNTYITWLSDQLEGAAGSLSLAQTQAAVDRAMNTWDTVDCATIPLVKLPDYGIDWGYLQWMYGFGGIPGWYADITEAGWLPGSFFDTLFGSGASDSVIGVTFTFIWIDSSTGEPTDMDNNGKTDVAFKEIYYNNKFPWGIDTDWPIDVETVVLHENGHALSLGHFGKLFRTDANGKLHFAPMAVMNAGYTYVQQILSGTDNAAFCSVWSSWPNN